MSENNKESPATQDVLPPGGDWQIIVDENFDINKSIPFFNNENLNTTIINIETSESQRDNAKDSSHKTPLNEVQRSDEETIGREEKGLSFLSLQEDDYSRSNQAIEKKRVILQ